MSEVSQTIILGDGSGRLGNCLQAAVASALDLPLDEVPHFAEVEDWWRALVEFVQERGSNVVLRPASDGPPVLGLAFGQSPRGVMHAVVCRDGEVVWDPHPSRDGLSSVSSYVRFDALVESGAT